MLEIWVRVSHKNLSRKCSQKLRDRAKQSTTDAIKTDWKKEIGKSSDGTGDSIGNKIADKITRDSKTSPQKSSEANDEEILRERFILPE